MSMILKISRVKICCISSIEEDIDEVEPFAVDVCSGVRTDGYLNKIKLELFFKAIN
jgi:phosphoribosylanthranilate isomerase